jgi:hypothetical protein
MATTGGKRAQKFTLGLGWKVTFFPRFQEFSLGFIWQTYCHTGFYVLSFRCLGMRTKPPGLHSELPGALISPAVNRW